MESDYYFVRKPNSPRLEISEWIKTKFSTTKKNTFFNRFILTQRKISVREEYTINIKMTTTAAQREQEMTDTPQNWIWQRTHDVPRSSRRVYFFFNILNQPITILFVIVCLQYPTNYYKFHRRSSPSVCVVDINTCYGFCRQEIIDVSDGLRGCVSATGW